MLYETWDRFRLQEQPESPHNGPPEAYKKHIGYFWPLGCGSQDVTNVISDSVEICWTFDLFLAMEM